jgi:hypothetical protein
MKSLAFIVSVSIVALACSFADAGRFADRRAERLANRNGQSQGCDSAQPGTTYQFVPAAATCTTAPTYAVPTPTLAVTFDPPVKAATLPANIQADVAQMSKDFLQLETDVLANENVKGVTPETKAKIKAYKDKKTVRKNTRGATAVNLQQLLADIVADIPELLSIWGDLSPLIPAL